MPASGKQTKRLNLVLPGQLYDTLQEVADERHTSLQDLIRRFLKLGLLAHEVEGTPGSEFLIREGDVERRILLL